MNNFERENENKVREILAKAAGKHTLTWPFGEQGKCAECGIEIDGDHLYCPRCLDSDRISDEQAQDKTAKAKDRVAWSEWFDRTDGLPGE